MLSFTRSVTRTATALAAGLVFTLAACSSESDPFDGIPAFPVDAPEVTVLNEGENPVRLAYRDQGNAGGGEWSTTVAVSTGVDQHTEAPGTAVDPHAPAGGDLDTTTLPLSVTSGTAPAPGDGEQDAARVRPLEAGQHAQERGLATAIIASQPRNRRFRDRDFYRSDAEGRATGLRKVPPFFLCCTPASR